jgi:hypothetical protein
MAHQLYHLAQLNLGRLLAPMDDPRIHDFANGLDVINALAEMSEGFVWRLQDDESGDATSIQAFDDELIIVNMSVWDSLDALKDFVYSSRHVEFLRRRREWFEKFQSAYMVLWWIPASHTPTIDEAKERLAWLNEHGETAFAFTFKNPFSVAELAQMQHTQLHQTMLTGCLPPFPMAEPVS